MNDLQIPYYDDLPDYQTFLNQHLIPNMPAIFGPSAIANWKARRDWVVYITDQNEQRAVPNYSWLRDHFGKATVDVADCTERYYTDQKRTQMTFDKFVDAWQDSAQDGRYYLKDWHFTRIKGAQDDYEVLSVFSDDWLNEFWPACGNDDYRFAYMGSHGTFTPFHADVYRSYSWSSNICGTKKWTLFPPGQEHLYKDALGNLVYDIRHVDPQTFPHFADARCIVIHQRQGETIFVPSNWFHQVENIGATISINHNWGNACNIETMYASMEKDLADVRRTIEDIEHEMLPNEFISTCQNMLLAHSGWNWSIVVRLLTHIARRIAQQSSHTFQPDAIWQMKKIRTVFEQLNQDNAFCIYIQDHGLQPLVGELMSYLDRRTDSV